MNTEKAMLPHEVLMTAQKIDDYKERVSYLKHHAYKQVKTILQLAYNDRIVLDLPEGAPPYRENEEDRFAIASLTNTFAPIKNCVKSAKIPKIQKERTFIRILEALSPEDAKILIAAKDGKLSGFNRKKYSRITRKLVKDAFPELL